MSHGNNSVAQCSAGFSLSWFSFPRTHCSAATGTVSRVEGVLADLTRRLTDTTRREVSDGSAHATAAWFDFLDGWMGSIEKELVRPSTLRQTVEGLSPPVATPPPAIQQIFGADHVALRFALSFHVWPRGTILTSSSQCFPRGHRYYQFYLCTARRFAGLGIFSGAL